MPAQTESASYKKMQWDMKQNNRIVAYTLRAHSLTPNAM